MHNVTLEFSRMALLSTSDCLAVYDSDKPDPNQRAAKWCGNMPYASNQQQVNPPPGKLVLHSGTAYLEWTTYQRTTGAKGFSATWAFTARDASASAPTAVCGGGVLTAGTGTLVDTAPEDTDGQLYYKGTNCRRVIQAPLGSVVRLTVRKWTIPTSTGAGAVTLCRGSDVDVACGGKDDPAYLAVMNTYGKAPRVGFVEEIPDRAVVVQWATPYSQYTAMSTGFELDWTFDPPCTFGQPPPQGNPIRCIRSCLLVCTRWPHVAAACCLLRP